MKLIIFGYGKDFNLLLQFIIFIQPYTHKPLALYQLEIIPVPIKDNNTEANSYTLLQTRKDYLTIIEKHDASLMTFELSTC